MISEELIRQELANSQKFFTLVKNLDIKKMAVAGVINIGSLSEREREDIMVWIHEKEVEYEWENVPTAIKKYVEK